MRKLNTLTYAVALAAVAAAALGAQTTSMTLRPESKVTLAGSSNVHDWSCKGGEFNATVEVDPAFSTDPLTEIARPITRVSVTIPVKSLKCGHGKMDQNMYKALRVTEFPDIEYVLSSYEIDASTRTADRFVARTVGDLTVAGETTRVEIPITAERTADGSTTGEGTVRLLMTAFGIKPPVALLGTLRTKNEIDVSFRVLLDKTTTAALLQP